MGQRTYSAFRGQRRAAGLFVLALLALGCGGGNDYYYVNDIRGEGDTIRLAFVYTCGLIDVTWDGRFGGGPPRFYADLAVKHDALGGDCEEEPREVPYDVLPMKQTFRVEYPPPTPLGVRIAPYEEEQGAICLSNLFDEGPFKGRRCQ